MGASNVNGAENDQAAARPVAGREDPDVTDTFESCSTTTGPSTSRSRKTATA
jgi:hypothetical protein